MKAQNGIVVLISLIAIAACSTVHGDGKCSSDGAALEVANAIVAQRWPYELQPPYPKPILKDTNNIWMVEYGISEGWTGGAPTFYVNKKTCKVEKIISGQ